MEKEKCEKWYGTRHTFGKWELYREGHLLKDNHEPVGAFLEQCRTCEVCNYVEIKRQETL